jgi:hypothetical protein
MSNYNDPNAPHGGGSRLGNKYGSGYPNNDYSGQQPRFTHATPSSTSGAVKNITVTLVTALVVPILLFVIDYRKTSLEEQKILNEYKMASNEMESPAQKIRDSLAAVRYKEETEKALSNYLQIHQIMYKLKYKIPDATHITVWKIHNHGGILNTSEQQFVTVLYTTDVDDEVPETDIKADWQRRELYIGYAWFYEQIKVKGYFDMPDVSKEENFYFGNAKNYSKFIGTKSIAGVYVKAEANAMYFLTASFQHTNPTATDPFIEVKLSNAKAQLRNLINPASEVLKTRE